MTAATAEVCRQRLLDIRLARLCVLIQQRFRAHDHAVRAIAALHRLLVDEGFLQRMKLIPRAETFECHDGFSSRGAQRDLAGTNGFTPDKHSASAALAEPATEFRAGKIQIVAQDIKQRCVARGLDILHLAVDVQAGILGHGEFPVQTCIRNSGKHHVCAPARQDSAPGDGGFCFRAEPCMGTRHGAFPRPDVKMRADFPLPFSPLRTLLGGKEGSFVLCAMFTANYALKAQRLAASCEKFGVPFVLHEVAAVHHSISSRGVPDLAFAKPNFIRHLLDTHRKPVLYVDADCEILAEPELIGSLALTGCDFAVYNWLADEHNDAFAPIELSVAGGQPVRNRYFVFSHRVEYFSSSQLLCSGPVQFYGNSDKARRLLAEWFRTVEAFPGAPDDECLDFAFNNAGENFSALKTHWLPKSYARYSWWITEQPVINHPEEPSMDGNFLSLDDIAGKPRFDMARAQASDGTPLFPRDCVIDTETGILYRIAGTQLAAIGRTERKFWI
jgi:hypothetical protein